MYNDFKKSGIIHKLISSKIKEELYNGISALEIVESIEDKINQFTKFDENNPLKSGIAFPVGISINDIAAHFTPSLNNNPIISDSDVVKIDYGVHINGCISDGAFSWCPNNKYNELIKISKEATEVGIKNSGPDAILGLIGAEIEEVINSYEIEIDNKVLPVRSIIDLCGHKIEPYKIHAGKVVPNVEIPYFERMKENEVYAIETFPTTGNGKTFEDLECNHFMIDESYKYDENIDYIYKTRSTLPFCPRWFSEDIPNNKYIKKYPVIKTSDNGIVAQYEKNVYIKNNGYEVLN